MESRVSMEDSIRLETILAEIESMKSDLQQLQDEIGKRATAYQLTELDGTVSLLLKRYETLDDSVAHRRRELKSLTIETRNMAEDLENMPNRYGQARTIDPDHYQKRAS